MMDERIIKVAFLFTSFLLLSSIILVKSNPVDSKSNSQEGPMDPPIVNTVQGKLQGSYGISRDGRSFSQFLGVKYAHIPQRFEIAIEPESWSGVKLATEYGPECSTITNPEDEANCLNLNVFTPILNVSNETKELLPTLIYIHGGSFKGNSNRYYGPNYFMDQNIVFVVINYRLGALGFLSTGDENCPGNNGLKDQVSAFKWVQKNIESFHGDKNKVTIMGQSAGSASITYHLVSPMSKGLFHSAIAESGTFLDPWAFTRNPVPVAEKLADLLDCPTTSSTKEMIQCLRQVPVANITDATIIREATVKWHAEPLAGFGPVIEPLIDGKENCTFLSKSPYESLIEGNVTKVPLLTGITKEEGIYLWAGYILYADFAKSYLEDLQTNWSGVAPVAFYFDEVTPPSQKDEISLKIRDFYFGSPPIINKTTFSNLSNLYSDRLFVNSAVKFINLYSKHSTVYPYLYTFNKYVGLEYVDVWNSLKIDQPIEATHAAELDMLLSPLFNRTRSEPDHDALSRNVLNLWTSFINNGSPSATFGSATDFPPVNPAEGLKQWYILDTDTQLQDNLFADRNAFWDSLQLLDNNFSKNPTNNNSKLN